MHACPCLPAILGRSGGLAWPLALAGAGDFALSLLVLLVCFFFLYLEAGVLDQRRQGPR
jgi:hypothetical protein